MNVSAGRQLKVYRIGMRVRRYRTNASFCDAWHSEARRAQLG